MAVTLTLRDVGESADEARDRGGEPLPLLITGAAGRVGRHVSAAAAASGRYRLRLWIQHEAQREEIAGLPGVDDARDVVVGDMLDADLRRRALEGIDSVLHLAANPSVSATWEELASPNVEGLYRMAEATRDAGCRRLVLMSSVNAVNAAPGQHRPMTEDIPAWPSSLYGATKALAESIAALFADPERLSVICVRLGGARRIDLDAQWVARHQWIRRSGLAMPDACDLLLRCVDDRRVIFGLFNATSATDTPDFDMTRAADVLGFRPAWRVTEQGFVPVADAAATPA